ncbi:sulfatase [Nonomuraea sp. K274]|uniref:Sulfatase n=1 Tax=Nonomuraea cypriaca TaxID=1187855 RepID=A0A931EY58_9ACTN|nr:sulfatase [Nonomuraea cypriaca]MBF8186142.1 sulfatase [Nonomuraea cypriaca]
MTNVILILSDSLNRHHLPAYADSPIPTPNIDRLLGRGHRFDNHFVGSLPCIPARRELFTGRQEFLWRPWGSLEPYDDRFPKLLAQAGYTTAITTDHYHYWEEPGNGYLQSFQSAELIRGHEVDFWKPPAYADEDVPRWVRSTERWRPRGPRQYYANVRDFETEDDFFTAKVIQSARDWLGRNTDRRPFYLQVELFDVHEPFHVPEPYRSMFWDGPGDWQDFTLWPPYQDPDLEAAFMAQVSEAELAYIRAQYAGKVAMLDHHLGKLFDTLDEQGLWDDTAVIFTTDHGHDLGERGHFAKQYPHYDSHANIPMIMWHPDHPGTGQGVSGLTQTVDLFATILDAAGVPVPEATNSRSVLPLLRDPGASVRDAVLYGSFGQGVCYSDGDWTLFKSPEADTQLYYYSASLYRSLHLDGAVPPQGAGYFMPGVGLPQWRVPVGIRPRERASMLFNRSEDPGQTADRWDDAPAVRARVLDSLRAAMSAEGCPPEQYERLGLGTAPDLTTTETRRVIPVGGRP